MSTITDRNAPATASVARGRDAVSTARNDVSLPDRLWLVAILVLAAALRAINLTRLPFEQDELYTFLESRDLFSVDLEPGIQARPLYFLLQHVLLQFADHTPLAMRFVPFLFGMLGVWLTWKVARDVFGSSAAIIAGFVAATSPWHVHASGYARYWSLVYLASVAFCYFLWRSYERDRVADYRFALLTLLIGSATHPSFVIGASAIVVGTTLVRRNGRLGWQWPTVRGWLNLWLPYAVLLGIAMLALVSSGNESSLQNWGGRGWFASLRLIPAVVEWATPVIVVAAALATILLLTDSASGRRRWAMMSLCGTAMTFVLLFVASMRTDVYADYAMVILPFIFIGAGAGIQLIADRVNGNKNLVVFSAAAVFGAAMAPSTLSHVVDGTRFDYRPALNYITQKEPGVTVLTWPLINARHYAPHLKSLPFSNQPDKLDSILTEHGDLWIIASTRRHGIVADDYNAVANWLSKHCTVDLSYERNRWDYRLFRVSVHRCQAPTGIAGR